MASKPVPKSTRENEKYVDTLDNASRGRYFTKLELIGGLDPYQVTPRDWTSAYDGLPEVTYFDIVNYLVYTQSAYTMDQMKAYKSLTAYNQFVSGWVRDVVHLLASDLVVVSAKVRHSQRMNETPLKPWLIVKPEGTVIAGHCNCMAGLGEVCSHVAALLFWIESAVKIKNSKTVTQEPAYWLLPTGIKNVEYKTVQEINFTSARTMKKRLDDDICGVTPPARPSTPQNLANVPELTEDEFGVFLDRLHKTNTKPVLLSIMPGYTEHYIPASLSDSFPTILSELFDENCADMDKESLVAHCENVFARVTVTESQAENVERQTRRQANNRDWFRFRTGRVTASQLKSVCHTTLTQPAKSVIQAICYPEAVRFSTRATRWGCSHEEEALTKYCDLMDKKHDNFQCTPCGLVLHPEYPYMGASPDSLVSCDCCGLGTVEVKCPYCVREATLTESQGKNSCLEDVDGKLSLKHAHRYYYQVQAQIFLCNRDYCDFVVWTEVDLHIQRIEPNTSFWENACSTAEVFFKRCILPELVGKFYSARKPCAPLVSDDNQSSHSPHSAQPAAKTGHDDLIICICQVKYDDTYDRVIGCDNDNCPYQWLHFKCINIKRAPKGDWYCPECRNLPEFVNVV